MIKKAIVISAPAGGKAEIEIKRECACSGGENCGSHCFSGGSEIIRAKAANDAGASPGDIVEVESGTAVILSYAAAVFLLPIAVGLILFFAVQSLAKSQIAAYIASGAGFISVILILYYILNKVAKSRSDLKIIRIMGKQ
ncbi:hypothetical protein FACS1894219_07420 [Clostridia bacterium]|nr:hypothetical protein FACS1894219_07420 [Clostridia bacterium]